MKKTLLSLGFLFLAFGGWSQDCPPPFGMAMHDANQFRFFTSGGGQVIGGPNGSPGLLARFDDGQYKSLAYAVGLWMGGLDAANNIHMAVASYPVSEDYYPGPLPHNPALDALPDCGEFFDRQFVVLREVAELHRQYGLCLNDPNCDLEALFPLGYEVPESISEYPGETSAMGAQGAPFFDVDGDGFYSAEAGDFPLFASMPEADDCCTSLKGDLAVIWFANDLGNAHGTSFADPIGVEIEQMIYLYFSNNDDEPLYHRLRMVNRRSEDLTNFHFGMFIDGDLGNSTDDLGGSDPSRDMVFFYNADNNDEQSFFGPGWGETIPAVGYTALGLGNGAQVPLTSAIFQDPSLGPNTFPSTGMQYYNWISGKYISGVPVTGNPSPEAVQFQGYPDGSEGLPGGDTRVAFGFPAIAFAPDTEICYEGALLVAPNTGGVAPTEAAAALADIRDLAHSQWSSCFACVPPVVRMVITPTNGGYSFMNLSEADTYEWDFGDGNTSNERFPQHVYAAAGSYTVTLTVSNECGLASGIAVVDAVVSVDQASAEGEKMKVYPNPANALVTFEVQQLSLGVNRLLISDMAGRIIVDAPVTAQRTELNTAQLPAGIYTVALHVNGQPMHRTRLTVQH